jgi:hypothetical protein
LVGCNLGCHGPVDKVAGAAQNSTPGVAFLKDCNAWGEVRSGALQGLDPDGKTRTYLRTGQTKEALEYIDCSELVYRVLAADGITKESETGTTLDLQTLLGNEDKFIHSDDEPKPGDIFLWRTGDDGHGHTGIVESVDADGTVHTIEAYGTDEGTDRFTYKKRKDGKIKELTGHEGWKGFFRPKGDDKDKSDNSVPKNETPAQKFARLMKESGEALKKSNKTLQQQQFENELERERDERDSILQ